MIFKNDSKSTNFNLEEEKSDKIEENRVVDELKPI